MIYRFEECELDAGRVELCRAGETVAIEPQVFDLLLCLIERRGQLVTKEELLDTVWGDRFVGESALTSRIKSARRAIGDDGTAQRLIRTVHGKGYEFVGSVSEGDGASTLSEAASPEGTAAADSLAVAATPPNLPLSVHSLIGRDHVLAQLTEALVESRLLTIVGPAGVGKTSLGLELARRESTSRPDGVALVELVTIRDGDELLATVATELDVNVQQQSSIGEAIVDLLRTRRLLLLVDNCEHLIEPIAALIERILRAAPGVTVVATSREPLAVPGERVYIVEPLAVDELDPSDLDGFAHVPAVALFVERAQAADARFALTPENAAAVAEICRRLDGIPLALELAASRTHAIDVGDIATRLDERLRLLRAVRRGADPRHSTLLDAVSWSYDLLEPDEQQLFNQLAVFSGSFDLDQAEAICEGDDVVDLLARLSQQSMLAVRRRGSTRTRYEMLETLREFGRNRLDELENVHLFSRHARYFADLATHTDAVLHTPDESDGVRAIDQSFADVRAAQRFAVDVGDVDTALALITSVREYAMRTMRYEVFTWADQAAQLVAESSHPLRPMLSAIRAYGAFVRGEFERSNELVDLAAEDERSLGLSTNGLVERVRGNLLYMVGDEADAHVMCSKLIDVAEDAGTASQRAHAYYMSSISSSCIGHADEAASRYEAAFANARATGSPTDLAGAWVAKGFASPDDDEAALDAFASGDRLARAAGNRWMSAFACTEASGLRVAMGDLRRGCDGLAETVDIWSRTGEWAQQWLTLSRCVIALDRIERPELAAEVLGGLETHTSVDASPVLPTVRDLALATRASLFDRLGDERMDELRATGAQLPVAELVHRTRNALLGRTDQP